MADLRRYKRHAERFGVELVFETAVGLYPGQQPDLGVLENRSGALRRRCPT